jgi:Rieske Fe-S protein
MSKTQPADQSLKHQVKQPARLGAATIAGVIAAGMLSVSAYAQTPAAPATATSPATTTMPATGAQSTAPGVPPGMVQIEPPKDPLVERREARRQAAAEYKAKKKEAKQEYKQEVGSAKQERKAENKAANEAARQELSAPKQ